MISSTKSVKKKDRIKYFKEIVEVDINFNLKHRKQKNYRSVKHEAVIKKRKARRKKKTLFALC